MLMQVDIHKKPIVVVIVEDEPMVRMAAVGAFEDAGFEVLESKNAQAAMVILQAQGGRVHALFTDVEMPGEMDGLGLANQIHHDWPAISVVVASGQVTPCEGQMPANSRFFKKPYQLSSIIEHFRAQTPTA